MLHYLNMSYRHTYYGVRTLPCVLSVTSFVYLKFTFNTLSLTKGSSSSIPALD